jgi:hypothetical protein
MAALPPIDAESSAVAATHDLPPIPKRWTPEDKTQVMAWHRDGLGNTEISRRLGYSLDQVIHMVRHGQSRS